MEIARDRLAPNPGHDDAGEEENSHPVKPNHALHVAAERKGLRFG
jgi:hypothetical protein